MKKISTALVSAVALASVISVAGTVNADVRHPASQSTQKGGINLY